MTDLLTAVSSVSLNRTKPEDIEKEQRIVGNVSEKNRLLISSPDHALEVLKSQPDRHDLLAVLQYLDRGSQDGFDIRIPGPSSAKIINEVITSTIPDYWASIGSDKQLLLRCLTSVAGIGGLVARIKLWTLQLGPKKKETPTTTDTARPLADLISVLDQLLKADDFVHVVWNDLSLLSKTSMQRKLMWNEFVSLIASGKFVSAVAEAEDLTSTAGGRESSSWVSSGSAYSAWLGRNVATLTRLASKDAGDGIDAAAQLCGKAVGIGYPAALIEQLHRGLSFSSPSDLPMLHLLAKQLRGQEQTRFVEITVRLAVRHYKLGAIPVDTSCSNSMRGAAALISGTIGQDDSLRDRLTTWLSDPAVNSAEPIAARRFALAALSSDAERMQSTMEGCLKLFGENLFIKHSPMVQQEACMQVLLLSAGYVHRSDPMFLFTLARSSYHLSGTSNRLSASSPRARNLGMIVGMAISELVDKCGQRMTFDIADMKTAEAASCMQLVHVSDTVGSLEELQVGSDRSLATRSAANFKVTLTTKSTKTMQKPRPSTIQGPRVVEVLDDSEDDGLIPYGKPDSDPEDEDEDPTLVNRNKAKAPVYIRDLIAGLQDTENYEQYSLSLTHAAGLIRRKTGFGKEVTDHAMELATILTGLGDPFEIDHFPELRLQALIAVLLSNPAQIAPWLAGQVFVGEYSLNQRATVLSALGLGARELAGFKDMDELNPKPALVDFPSKKLPQRLHKLYTAEQSHVQLIASNLQQSMVQPMAAQAADQVAGPNALKVRTFSSRMEVEKKRKKAIPNALAKVVAESFFFPLTGRWWQNMQAYGPNNVQFQPFLLSTYIKTLALLLHASGPSTLSLPQMTSEFWDLLLNVRMNALNDPSVLEAVLFALLTLLEVNEDKRRIAEHHSKQLIETQEWAEIVFERTAGRDAEGEKVGMLAASVLMKTREVVEKYQRLLVGDMMDY